MPDSVWKQLLRIIFLLTLGVVTRPFLKMLVVAVVDPHLFLRALSYPYFAFAMGFYRIVDLLEAIPLSIAMYFWTSDSITGKVFYSALVILFWVSLFLASGVLRV